MRRIVATVVLAGLVLAACGSRVAEETAAPTATTASGPRDQLAGSACDLVTDEEASEILGAPATRLEGRGAVPGGAGASCAWGTKAGGILSVTVADDVAYEAAKRAAKRGFSAATGQTAIELAFEEVEGLGDDAFLQRYRVGGRGAQGFLQVRVRGLHLTFTITTDPARLLERAPRIISRVRVQRG